MKACSVCGVTKALEEFQVRRASKDGRTAACRSCLSERDRARANLPHRVKARSDYAQTGAGIEARNRARDRYARSSHGRAKRRESVAGWRSRNPLVRNAHAAVERAVKSGRLQRWPCEVCGETAHAHHPDYSMPLVVTWLCPAHHKQVHAEADRIHAAEAVLQQPAVQAESRSSDH